jgi:CRISPR type III-B/RAMP module-associated protein Cmr5
MAVRTLTQQRAGAALAAIEAVRRQRWQADYKRQAKGLPAMLLASGLAPTLAFLSSKGDAHAELAGHISSWILHSVFGKDEDGSVERCLHALAEADSAGYRRAEGEALEIAGWLKRLADAYLEGGES